MNTPRIASSARSGSSSWLARMSEAPDASCANEARRRSLFQRDAWTMPRPRKATTSVIVRPTGRRRGAHSERGRPIRVRTIGVAMSRPARSPSHQVAQVTGVFAAVTIAAARRATVEMLAPTTLLAAQQARKAATSRGMRQRQRLAHEAAHERRADGGLQRRREGDDERHGDDERIARSRATH